MFNVRQAGKVPMEIRVRTRERERARNQEREREKEGDTEKEIRDEAFSIGTLNQAKIPRQAKHTYAWFRNS